MGDDSEGPRKDGINSAGPGRNLQGGGAIRVTLWKRELGGDQGDDQGPDGIPPVISKTDHRDDVETWGRRRVGVSRSRGGNELRGATPHWSINKEDADNHIGEGDLPACICVLHGGGENDGDDPDGALVRSRRGKRAGGINEEEV